MLCTLRPTGPSRGGRKEQNLGVLGVPCLEAAAPATSRLLAGSDGRPWSFPQQSLELCHWGSAAVSSGLVERVTSVQPFSLKKHTVSQATWICPPKTGKIKKESAKF